MLLLFCLAAHFFSGTVEIIGRLGQAWSRREKQIIVLDHFKQQIRRMTHEEKHCCGASVRHAAP